MYSIALRLLAEDLEEEEFHQQRVIRRNLRDNSNPLDLPENVFQQYYRLNKPAFLYLLEVVSTFLPPCKKAFAIPPIVKLSACLRFLAEGGFQKCAETDRVVGLAQSTFSEVLTEVLDILHTEVAPKWLKWMTAEEKNQVASSFSQKYGLPGVVGCIDGTHVRIKSPARNKQLYYNENGYYSLNVMLVCDDQLRIRYVDGTHPGTCQDSFIWKLSELKARMQQDYSCGLTHFRLLGDGDYPLEPWLLTPHTAPKVNSPEYRFNEAHSRCHGIIQGVIDMWKNRWRCIRGAKELHYSPEKAVQIVNVCSALHNICIFYKVNETDLLQAEVDTDGQRYLAAAQRIREEIGNSL